MKWISVVIALLIQLTASPAFAISVDFSSLGPPAFDPPLTVDITAPNSLTLSGVTFTYDNFGSTHPFDTASADMGGIFGSTYGALNLDFGTGVSALTFDFGLFGVPDQDPALAAIFDNGDVVSLAGLFTPYDPQAPSQGDIFGNFSYTAPSIFRMASIIFSPVVDPGQTTPDAYVPYFFSIGNMSYDPAVAPVPEPGTVLLLALGFAGLAGARVYKRRTAA